MKSVNRARTHKGMFKAPRWAVLAFISPCFGSIAACDGEGTDQAGVETQGAAGTTAAPVPGTSGSVAESTATAGRGEAGTGVIVTTTAGTSPSGGKGDAGARSSVAGAGAAGSSAIGGSAAAGMAAAGSGAPAVGGSSADSGSAAGSGAAGSGPAAGGDNSCLAGITNYDMPGKFQVMTTRAESVHFYVPMVPAGCKVPVVHLSNGTGGTCNGYKAILNHMASHGFLATCYESTNTGSGKPCMDALTAAYMRYPDLADDKIGSTGHSQGGGAAITCVYLAEMRWGTMRKYTGHAMEPAHGMNRSGYMSEYPKIKSPIFMFSGSRDTIVSSSWVRQGYAPLTCEKIWYEATGAPHVPVPTSWTQESAVAWFRWKLLDDEAAGTYFKMLPSTDRWDAVMGTPTM